MSGTHDTSELVDIGGPAEVTLFWHAIDLPIENRQGELQRALDEAWAHFGKIEDERLLALVAALCIEEAVQLVLVAIGPGFADLEDDSDFTFSMKIKAAMALHLLPARILTACDLIRGIRNAFAHDLGLKTFADLDQKKYLAKLAPAVRSFNDAERNLDDYARLFRELTAFILLALRVYSRQIAFLRTWIMAPESRTAFSEWARQWRK